MSDDLTPDPEFKALEARVHAHVLPMIRKSAMTMTVVPKGETDIKFAVELGLSIMLDKPLVLVIRPGMKIPDKLRAIADEVIEIDIADPEQAQAAQGVIAAAVARFTGE